MCLKRSASQITFNLKQQLLKGCMMIDIHNVFEHYCNNGRKIKVMKTGTMALGFREGHTNVYFWGRIRERFLREMISGSFLEGDVVTCQLQGQRKNTLRREVLAKAGEWKATVCLCEYREILQRTMEKEGFWMSFEEVFLHFSHTITRNVFKCRNQYLYQNSYFIVISSE